MKQPPEIVPVAFDLPDEVIPIIRHTLSLFENHYAVRFVDDRDAAFRISDNEGADIRISEKFIAALRTRQFDHQDLMQDQPLIFQPGGDPDYLGTCAYMAHFLQEYTGEPDCFDELDRFKYARSYQHRYHCIQDNLVLKYLIALKQECKKLNHLQRNAWPSRLWVSHDIDYLYHSVWPELKTALKNLRLDQLRKLLLNQDWSQVDTTLFEKILSINQRQGLKATFFWLANDAKYRSKSGRVIENANYQMQDDLVQKLIRLIQQHGGDLGVHRSLGCHNLEAEKNKIHPDITINRNHYLAGKLPDLWRSLEESKITRDATAGFANTMGFRNSYGTPLRPFDLDRNQPFNIMEYPLHIMDTTFIHKNQPAEQTSRQIKDFIRANPTDCIISLLWHNNYFSEVKFPSWTSLYEEIIQLFPEDQRG